MTKEDIKDLAITIVAETKKVYSTARKSKNDSPNKVKQVLKRIEIVDSENSYQVHIPAELSMYHYGLKNIKFDTKTTSIEKAVFNGVQKYFSMRSTKEFESRIEESTVIIQ